jgi:molybdenum cofactor cytidylyltransferase
MAPDVQARGEAAGEARGVAGLVLAAGRSTRMGHNKLLCTWRDAPLVVHAVDAALGAGLRPLCVVTGHEHEGVTAALGGRELARAHNPDFEQGMASSLRVGLEALGQGPDGVVVLLGDMPRVRAEHVARLLAAFELGGRSVICVPEHQGQRGNPVLWPRRDYAALRSLSGDRGGRDLLETAIGRVVRVAMPDDGVLIDVDSPQMLAALHAETTEPLA